MMFRFIKSFSKGQVTIPKEIREALGLEDDFWLKVSLQENKIIAEPIKETLAPSLKNYSSKLLKIKGVWFSEKDWQEIRKEVDQRTT